MKALCALAVIGLSLLGSFGLAYSQPYGGPGYGYRERDYDVYRDRGRYRHRDYAFDEREYLRCNPDVLRAVRRGATPSGWAHYQMYGRYENRRLRC
jgi:hypothetical protein